MERLGFAAKAIMDQTKGNGSGSLDCRDYVTQVSRELAERVMHQRDVMLKLIDLHQAREHSIDYCPLVDCAPMKGLREGLREAISVLEETRRSFKSRRLEELRLKLEALLVEDRD